MGKLIDYVLAEPLITIIVLTFLAFFAGFAGGRRWGKREGFAEGIAYAPLEMRRQTWEDGHCVICGTGSEAGDEAPPDGDDAESDKAGFFPHTQPGA